MAADLMTVRPAGRGYEILTTIDSLEGETWEPLASFLVAGQQLEAPGSGILDVSLHDGLLAEGWIAPFQPLPVCGLGCRGAPFARCLLRTGHDGWHEDCGFRWKVGR